MEHHDLSFIDTNIVLACFRSQGDGSLSSANNKSQPNNNSTQCQPTKNTSDFIYSTDSDFYYVDGKLKEIDDFYREVRNAERLHENNKLNVAPVIIDPVYEIIAEVSDADELYCLPHDTKKDISNNHDNKKLKLKPQDKIKSICRSISSPLKMNEFLHNSSNNSKVKRSNSSYRQCGEDQHDINIQSWLRQDTTALPQPNNNNNHTVSSNVSSLRLQPNKHGSSLTLVKPSSNIMYTNINNLQQTIRDQQEQLLTQLGHQRPQFVAPPPPAGPPPPPQHNSNVIQQHEQSTSFMSPGDSNTISGGDQHWEWRIKVIKAKRYFLTLYFFLVPCSCTEFFVSTYSIF